MGLQRCPPTLLTLDNLLVGSADLRILQAAVEFETKLVSERVREHPAHVEASGPPVQSPPDRLLPHHAVESILKDARWQEWEYAAPGRVTVWVCYNGRCSRERFRLSPGGSVGTVFSAMGDLLIPHPFLALIPAAVFALTGRMTRRRPLFAAAALWLSYSVYEYLMHRRVLCSGECNIRIDLLAIYPVLVLGTVAALVYLVYAFACAANPVRRTT
jgi:hypothetical protein